MSDRATAAIPTPRTQNVDTTKILVEELQKLGDPLPIPVAKMRSERRSWTWSSNHEGENGE